MDGPHTLSKALGISRDGKTAVGEALVVSFVRAWRLDIDWAISTGDGTPPLYNELQVLEDLGVVAPSRPSAAFGASDQTADTDDSCVYDKSALTLDFCGSVVVGNFRIGNVVYAAEWLAPVLDDLDEDHDYATIQDFGSGADYMTAKDVSRDGQMMVGYGNNNQGPVAFWAELEQHPTDPEAKILVMYSLAVTDGEKNLKWAIAEAVSEDGYEIVGYGGTAGKGSRDRAFYSKVLGFDQITDAITLESYLLPNLLGGQNAKAHAMTKNLDGDRVFIVGECESSKGWMACLWFVDETSESPGGWVVKALGSLSSNEVQSVATGVAYRELPVPTVGELIVVGNSLSNQDPSEAFVWSGNPSLVDEPDTGYFYDLEYIVTKTGAGAVSDMGSNWILKEATGISESGDRIVGWGISPEGGIEAWAVTGFPLGELDLSKEG
jgi:uncharacterized membrane protein